MLNLDDIKVNDLKVTFNDLTKLIEEDKDYRIRFVLQKKDLSIILYENE